MKEHVNLKELQWNDTLVKFGGHQITALTRVHDLWDLFVNSLPGTFYPPPRVSDPDMHHGTCATHVPWCMPGSLNSGFLLSRWRVKRSRHSRRMHNPQFYVSGSNVDTQLPSTQLCAPPTKMADGPDGKIKQCRFLRVYRLLSYSKDMPLVGWLFEPLY